MLSLLYVFFWVIPRRLNSDAGELPRRKHTTFRTRRKFEIKKCLVSSPVKTKAANYSEMLVSIYQTMWRHSWEKTVILT
jgi:hypothetical protein